MCGLLRAVLLLLQCMSLLNLSGWLNFWLLNSVAFHEFSSFTFDWRLPSCCKQQAILFSKQWFSGMLEILLLAMEWKTAYCEWLLYRAKWSFIVSADLNWSGEIFYQKITHSKQFNIIQLVQKRGFERNYLKLFNK